MRCELCRQSISTTFLNKQVGTMVKDKEGKRHHVCAVCQQKNPAKKALLAALSAPVA